MPWPKTNPIWEDPANVQRLIALSQQGASESRMAYELNCSRNAVHKKLERLGLLKEQKFEPLPPPKLEPLPKGAKTLPPLPSLMGMDLEG
jgi:hypothetical protein